MKVELYVIGLTERGVRCAVPRDTGWDFWLPRGGPHVTWAEPPEIGATINATMPGWLASKHKQLAPTRNQPMLRFTEPAGLDPAKAQGLIPMAYDNEKTGALFKNAKKEKPSHPDYRGSCEIGGRKFWISSWLKKSKDGETYMSLAFTEAEEQRVSAQSTSEPVRPAFDRRVDEEIPF